MKKYLNIGIFSYLLLLLVGCSDMNDKHDMYLQDGERLFIGRVDSVNLLPGKDRFLLKYWLSDPRVDNLKIYWNQKQDSLLFPVREHLASDPQEVMVNNMLEGQYSFLLYSTNETGLRSVAYETDVNVYGSDYYSTLNNRTLNSVDFDESSGKLSLILSDPVTNDDIGIRFFYTDRNGNVKEDMLQTASGTSIDLYVDQTKPVTYSTCYLPEPTAIDTFYVDPTKVMIYKEVNVALFKPVSIKPGDMYAANYTADKAVDGIISNESRYFAKDDGTEHWIEIDLEQEYSISSFATWIGAGGTLGYPVANFYFQAWINDKWVNLVSVTGNTNPQYKTTFPEVKTQKVKYYVPAYSGNALRLYEIAVYSRISY
jgi:hypothetical protein